MTFLGSTGANLSVARGALLSDLKRDESIKGTRLSGVKARANDKWVYPEFAKKYEPIWKKWLDIRQYWLDKKKTKSDLAFPYLGTSNSIDPISESLLDKTRATATIFTKQLGLTWITPREWRGFKSKLIGKSSNNDIFASAEILGHSVTTAVRHYATRNIDDAVIQISNALDKVYDSAIRRARSTSTSEVAISFQRDELKTTAIGECQSEDALRPALAQGFTEFAPAPNCSIKETCIFCDKYAIHADSTDIRKLLSLKFLINELAANMSAESWSNKWSIYIDRIEEIIREIVSQSPSSEALINEISDDIEYGELDDFWADWYRTLKHLGIVTS